MQGSSSAQSEVTKQAREWLEKAACRMPVDVYFVVLAV